MSKNLSEKTQKVLKRIRKRFKVGFSPLKVQDLELDMLQVTDLEHLLAGKDPFENVSEFPFWVKLWEASMVLAHVMASMPEASGTWCWYGSSGSGGGCSRLRGDLK